MDPSSWTFSCRPLDYTLAEGSQIPWSKIIQQIQLLNVTPGQTSDYLTYLDLFGKSCLFANRAEEAIQLLLEARLLHQKRPNLTSVLSLVTRNNLLLVSLEDNDHELRMEVAIELVSQEHWPPSMIINFLNSIQDRAPLKALKICTDLVDQVPKLIEIKEITEWLDVALKNLEN